MFFEIKKKTILEENIQKKKFPRGYIQKIKPQSNGFFFNYRQRSILQNKKKQLYLNLRKIIGSKVQKFGHHLKIGKNANKAKLTLFKLNQFL